VLKSDETLLAGIEEHMEEEKFEFAELCKEIIRRVRQWGGKMRRRELGKGYRRQASTGRDQAALTRTPDRRFRRI
jgi:hypothetical protein